MSLPKVLLLDGDGVIWINETPIKGVPEALDRIKAMGVRLVLVTNNCSKTRAQYKAFTERIGIHCFSEEDIFSSGFATAMYLLSRNYKEVFVSGFKALTEELRHHGITVHTLDTDPKPKKVDAVVVSKCPDFSFAAVARGTYLIKEYGAALIGANPDPNFPMPHGVLVCGGGAMLAAFETSANAKATIIGKPNDTMFSTVLNTLGITSDDVIMVGDRMCTDIAFASRHKARSVLVLSGIDTMSDVDKAAQDDKPTYVLPSVVELAETFESWRKRAVA